MSIFVTSTWKCVHNVPSRRKWVSGACRRKMCPQCAFQEENGNSICLPEGNLVCFGLPGGKCAFQEEMCTPCVCLEDQQDNVSTLCLWVERWNVSTMYGLRGKSVHDASVKENLSVCAHCTRRKMFPLGAIQVETYPLSCQRGKCVDYSMCIPGVKWVHLVPFRKKVSTMCLSGGKCINFAQMWPRMCFLWGMRLPRMHCIHKPPRRKMCPLCAIQEEMSTEYLPVEYACTICLPRRSSVHYVSTRSKKCPLLTLQEEVVFTMCLLGGKCIIYVQYVPCRRKMCPGGMCLPRMYCVHVPPRRKCENSVPDRRKM
jgi:hypothetical protein